MHAPAVPIDLLAEVRGDIANLQAKLDQLRAVEEYLASKLGKASSTSEHGTTQASVQMSSGTNVRRFCKMGQREAAIAVLKESGSPMRTGDIAREMVAGGFPWKEKTSRLANSLFTSFRRGPTVFRKVGTGLWGLIELPPE